MTEQKSVTPVGASTVLLCRDTPDGLETFMVVRHHRIDFASGALVFPGGKVAQSDRDEKVRERCEGLDGIDGAFLPFVVAAIRESFEECGILLARERGSDGLVPGSRLPELEPYRKPLADDEMSILEFLEKEDLVLACDRVHRYAHWITPEGMPKRFDTHFFIAAAPEDHIALHDGEESVDSVWITAKRAVEEAEEGKWTVIFPTRCNLLMLSESADLAEAIANSKARKIVTVTPWIENRESGPYLCIPPEAGYPVDGVEMAKEGLS